MKNGFYNLQDFPLQMFDGFNCRIIQDTVKNIKYPPYSRNIFLKEDIWKNVGFD